MKTLIGILPALIFVLACKGNSEPNGRELANEVCECYRKANALPNEDPRRTLEQDACIIRQGQAWDRVKNYEEQANRFNDQLANCPRAAVSGEVEE